MCTPLKAARHALGWTNPVVVGLLGEAGARAGVVVAAPAGLRVMLAGWENGYRQPSPAYQRLLCAVYGRDPADLGFVPACAGTGGGVGSEVDAVAALLYVAPLTTAALAGVAPAQARFYAACVRTDPHCPATGELAAGYRQVGAQSPPWLDRDRAHTASRVAATTPAARDLGPDRVPPWLRAHRLHGCGLAARLFLTG